MAKIHSHQVSEFLGRRVLENIVVERQSGSQVVLREGTTACSDDGERVMVVPSDLTLDITVSGKNGLDTGSESNSMYYVYLIMNIDTEEVASLLSLSDTSPTMPSGFTKKRIVSSVRNVSGSFLGFRQIGMRYMYDDYQTVYVGYPESYWQTLNLSSYVPSVSRLALMCSFIGKNTFGAQLPGSEQLFVRPGTWGGSFRVSSMDLNDSGGGSPDSHACDGGAFNLTLDSSRRMSFRSVTLGHLGHQTELHVNGFVLSI